MTANLYNRYVWLLDLVSSYNGITYEQINNAWQRSQLNDDGSPLPKRTLHNHIEAIDKMFDLEIECQRQGGYKYYIKGDGEGRITDAQQALLDHMRLSNALIGNSPIKGRVLLDKSLSYRYLNPLFKAMEESQCVNIRYWVEYYDEAANEERKKTMECQLEPYFVKQYQEWFVIGRAVEDDTIRIISFNHIRKITPLDEPFVFPTDFSVTDFIDDIPLLIEIDMPVFDNRDTFAYYRLGDKRMHRTCAGPFIPDEVIP